MALWAPFFLGEETRTKRLRGIVSVCPALAVGDAAKSKVCYPPTPPPHVGEKGLTPF